MTIVVIAPIKIIWNDEGKQQAAKEIFDSIKELGGRYIGTHR